MNVSMLLEMAAEGAPERIAVGSTTDGITASNLRASAQRAAAFFTSRDVRHIGLVDLNSQAVPLAFFGASIAGLPFAPINYRLTDDALRAIISRLAPGLIIAGGDTAERIRGIDGIELATREQFLSDVGKDYPNFTAPVVDPDDIALMLFTSGTTGAPKAAVLRHRHLVSYIISTVEYMGAHEDDAQLVSVPAYHVAGISAVLSCIYSGRRVVYLSSFEPGAWLDAVSQHEITQAMVVPTMLGRVLDLMEERHLTLSSLRHLSYGGGRMPLEVIERAMKLLPQVSFVNAYGLTETSSTITVLSPEDHRIAASSNDHEIRRRLTSVGRAHDGIDLEIRNNDGDVLPAGERGAIYVRGDQVAGEYLGKNALTEDGWFPTNDAGYVDDDGFLYLDGRLDDIIVRGAENLSPGEIEGALADHPAVADAAVVGIPDPEWGEAVAACVVLEKGANVTADELRAWVRERLRSTKTPQRIQFRDQMPYNETGKLLRRVLREELSDSSNS
jgi:acyl-CoA synthetase (AMP-forming)/AMP-acid ligase II